MKPLHRVIGSILIATLVAFIVVGAVGCRGGDPTGDGDAASARPVDPQARFTAEPTAGGGILVRFDHAELTRARFGFWTEPGKQAAIEVVDEGVDGDATTVTLAVADLGLKIRGRIEPSDSRTLVATFTIDAATDLRGVFGGGLEFVFPNPDRLPQRPALAADGTGWTLAMTAEQPLAVAIDPAPVTLTLKERDGVAVRIQFVGSEHPAGSKTYTVTVRLPTGGAVRPSIAQRYGSPDTSAWHPNTAVWNSWPVSLAFLNEADRPAGKRGPVTVRGDQLVFADGTPARFWGTNVVASALFDASDDDIVRQARRLAALGFNLVRIHHHDSGWVSPNVFEGSGTRKLRDAGLDRLDFWIKALQAEGIYVWLDLHVGRVFTRGDGVSGFEEFADKKNEGKGFNYVNADVERLMQEFAHSYLDRKNRYTGRRYADDPGVMGVLITNENDLAHHFGNMFLPDAGHPQHQRRFEALVRPFARKHGLPAGKVLRTWEAGPAKIALAEIESRFFRRAIGDLRKLGVKAPIATTNYWSGALYCLPSLTTGDIIDIHSYGKPELLGKNPRHQPNFMHYAAAGQVAGMPMSITEWNVPPPAADRFVAPVYVASIGALQGWDAPMLYAYAQPGLGPPTRPHRWAAHYDAALMAMMPAAAMIFRQGHVSQAKSTYRVDLSPDTLFGRDIHAGTSAAIRTLVERSRVVIGLPDTPQHDWDRAHRGDGTEIAVTDLDRDFIPAGQEFVQSDTGQLRRDWAAGVMTVDTPKSQAALGWVGGRSVALSTARFMIETPKAAVALTSLDDKPLAESSRILVTVIARVVTSAGNQMPYLAEPVRGKFAIEHRAKALELTPLLGASISTREPEPVPSRAKGGVHTLTIPHEYGTHWFLLSPPA